MKYEPLTLIYILILFILTEFIGLFITTQNYGEITQLPSQQRGETSLIISIIIITILFYLLIKLKLKKIIKLWLGLAVLTALFVSFNSFFPIMLALIIAFLLTILRMFSNNLYIHNLTELFVYGGIVSLFMGFFTPLSALLTLAIIAIYDYISVFITKHMVRLAKAQSELNVFSGLIINHKGETAMLGGGDIAFSLLFSSILGKNYGLPYAYVTIYFYVLALGILIALGKKNKFYPAMPFITIASVLSYAICLI